MQDWQTWAIAALAAVFIGISKAGFGGGLGVLTTPLCALAFPPKIALGILLPLLCAGDVFSLRHYWGKWEKRNLRYLLPGAVAGVVVGVHFVGDFSPRQLNLAIGVIAVAFVLFHLLRERIFRAEGAFAPSHKAGIPCGILTGITSSFAHGAGPVVSIFLVPQRLPKEIFVGTMVLLFTCVNWIKVPFFIGNGVITWATFKHSLIFLPLMPLGVWLGVWLNRRCPEVWFTRVVLIALFLSGVQLIFNFRFGTGS